MSEVKWVACPWGGRMHADGVQRDAGLSSDGVYRYWLSRTWGDPTRFPTLGIIMLNPSTADALEDDPTIRRCMGFARTWGYVGMKVCNLYAYRTKDPKELISFALAGKDVIGPKNDNFIANMVRHAGLVMHRTPDVLVAWGANDFARDRAATVAGLISGHGRLICLGKTNGGAPKHPLYAPANEPPRAWP